ncbi:uncharacterized protein LOC125198750 [Salvia hispanica]|nr:uncharacterized protein LOC125198750 [Salvia hispanica]
MILFDEGNKCFLAEDLHCTLDEWLEKKLVENMGRREACEYYCKDGTHMLWWRKIMKEFKDVFGPVTYGLAAIHRAKAFHGNILNGVAIKIKQDGTPIGILFNMTNDPKQETAENIKQLHCDDINDMKILMERAFMYPFDVSKVPLSEGITSDECNYLCLMQLNKRVSIADTEAQSLKGTWGLNLAIFWDEIEQIAFMKRVYRLIFDALPLYSFYDHFPIDYFKMYDWTKKVKSYGSHKLKTVLNFNFNGHTSFDKRSAKHGMDKLRFWRCCIEHMELKDGSNIENHRELMKIFPELLFEVVEVFHHTLHLNDYWPSIVSLFKDMGWDK